MEHASSWSESRRGDDVSGRDDTSGSTLDQGLHTVKEWTEKIKEQGRIPTMKLIQMALKNRNLRHMAHV